MWQCTQCGEDVEAGFEICWNCGAAVDGTRDSEFVPEPDDPAVPDLERVAAQRVFAHAVDHAATPHPLSRLELGSLICKTLALVLFAAATVLIIWLVSLVAMMGWTGQISSSHGFTLLLAYSVPVLALLGVGVFFWTQSVWLAARLTGADPRPIGIAPFAVSDAKAVAFSVVGLIYLFSGIRELAGLGVMILEGGFAIHDFYFHSQFCLIALQIGLAVWLVLGARGIVALIERARAAGHVEEAK